MVLATSPTVFLSESVTCPPNRWVLQHIVCTTHGASVNTRAAWNPFGQWAPRIGAHASRSTSSRTTSCAPASFTTSAAPVDVRTFRVSPNPARRNCHGSFYPRGEAPHAALRPARGARDPEAAGFDGRFGVAIGMAAAGQAGPQRLDAVFQPRAPRHRRTDVLHHAELAGGRE